MVVSGVPAVVAAMVEQEGKLAVSDKRLDVAPTGNVHLHGFSAMMGP